MGSHWDLETQEFHGGQSWRSCDNFREDFSVTTNAFGPPKSAVKAARDALDHIHHYPPADAGEVTSALANFCDWSASRMLVGNGASEFIDLVMKALPPGPFRAAPFIATYQEYHRAARAAGRPIYESSDEPKGADAADPAVTVYIRPNSPTGECASLDALEKVLTESPSLCMIVDESFLPFAGPKWRQMSALSLINRFPKRLLVIQSWTKLWSCTGIRIGSVCASSDWIKTLRKLQTPWSCNSLAQSFGIAAANDTEYLKQTWRLIPEWRRLTDSAFEDLGWSITPSPGWVPWVFVRCPSEQAAAMAAKVAHSSGCPVRHCASYGLPQYIRVAVRQPEHQRVLFDAWRKHFAVPNRS